MVFIKARVLCQAYLSKQTCAVKVNASYDPLGGVKGGLKFVSIVYSGTAGIYYVQLKNIFYRKDGITSINDGDTSFSMSNVVHFTSSIAEGTIPTAANATLKTTNVYDAANNRYVVYVHDYTGLKVLPTITRLNVEITYKKMAGAR